MRVIRIGKACFNNGDSFRLPGAATKGSNDIAVAITKGNRFYLPSGACVRCIQDYRPLFFPCCGGTITMNHADIKVTTPVQGCNDRILENRINAAMGFETS